MSIEAAIRSILVSNGAVSAVVSTRVYPTRTPDNATFPCISYQRVLSTREHRLDGAGNLTFSSFQIDIWTPKTTAGGGGGAEQARDLARKVQTALDGYRGTVLSVDIQGILSENETHGWEQEIEVYRVTQQWKVMHREG